MPDKGRYLSIGIFTDVYKPVINGVVNSIEILSKSLLNLHHKVYIFAPEYTGYKDEEVNIYRFKSINILPKVRYPLSIPYSRRLFNIINTLNLDIIHCHHPFLLGRVGQYFARRLNVPLVATLHTQYENYNHYIPLNKGLVKSITLWALRNFSNKCDMLIAPAESRKEQLQNYGIRSEIRVVPNCVELDLFRNSEGEKVRERYSISPEELVLIFVGRLAREKNIDFLIDCFKVISDLNSNVKLILVGDGPESRGLKIKASRKGLAQKIIFTGQVDYADIVDYYASADIFVSTSITEVHPLVLLEAMASGLPVVAVKSVGYIDTISHGRDGLLCNGEIKDFSEGVSYLLNDKLKREDMARAAREKAQQFSVKKTTNEIMGIYLSLLN